MPRKSFFPRYRCLIVEGEAAIVQKRRGGKAPLWDKLLTFPTKAEAEAYVNDMNKRDLVETMKVQAREKKKQLLSEKGCCGGSSHSGRGVVASPDVPLNAATANARGRNMGFTEEQGTLADELVEFAESVTASIEDDDVGEAKANLDKLIAKANELKKELDEIEVPGDLDSEV